MANLKSKRKGYPQLGFSLRVKQYDFFYDLWPNRTCAEKPRIRRVDNNRDPVCLTYWRLTVRHLFWRHYLGALAPYTDGNVRIALRNSDCRDLWADFALGFVSWWQDWSRWRKKTLMLIYNLDGEALHGQLTWAWDSTPHTNGSFRGEFKGPHSHFPASIEN